MKKYVTGIASGLACLSLGGLLAGFTPGPASSSILWRGPVQTSLDGARIPVSNRERDIAVYALKSTDRLPLNRSSDPIPGFVGPIERSPAQDLLAFALGGPSASMLQINGKSVSILTENGPSPVPVSQVGLGAMLSFLPSGAPRNSGNRELYSAGLEVAAIAGDGEVLSQNGRPLRWETAHPLCLAVPSLTKPSLSPQGPRSRPMPARATSYQGIVERYAQKYELDTSLVLAIMQTESGFNPTLVSSRDAHGLMQVVPATAGNEVHRWLGRSGMPTSTELLNPDNNIRYGVTYLHLLRTRHLDGITDPQSLEYCVIAAYNGGSGAVLRHFGPTKEAAYTAINNMQPQDVLARLTEKFPAKETRSFVRKVLNSRHQYLAIAAVDTTVSAATPMAAPTKAPMVVSAAAPAAVKVSPPTAPKFATPAATTLSVSRPNPKAAENRPAA